MPLSKGLEPVRDGAPALMETAFTAAAVYLATAAVLQTDPGQAAIAAPLGGDQSCVGEAGAVTLAWGREEILNDTRSPLGLSSGSRDSVAEAAR